MDPVGPEPRVIDLGRMPYAQAYDLQLAHHAEVLAGREAGEPDPGRLLLVEHDPPVITITRRPTAAANLIATPDTLHRTGVTVAETDRGGDITYHGPGQLVAYPILDLNVYRLRLHDYMRLLEAAVIDTVAGFGVMGVRDACATGVWVPAPGDRAEPGSGRSCRGGADSAKVCAMGVRIRRWVSMHGLALNVTTNLDHFRLIVPCGLAGRPVTSLRRELGENCPGMPTVKRALTRALALRLSAARAAASAPTIPE